MSWTLSSSFLVRPVNSDPMKDGQAPGARRPVMGNTGPKAGAGRPLTGRQGSAADMGQTFSKWMEFFIWP